MNTSVPPKLRFGTIAGIWYDLSGQRLPKQLDLIDAWFPGLVIAEEDSDGETKVPADYADREYRIHAVRYHGSLYSGGSTRVSQIAGRLIGTASGNREKERKSAELIQKHVADCFVTDMTLTPRLKANTKEKIDGLGKKRADALGQTLYDLLYRLAAARESMEEYERKTEPFAMDDETFDGIVYNAAYQLNLGTYDGLCNAYLWLLAGSFLRNEVGRVLRLYDSSFVAIRRQISATGTLTDKLNYLSHPEKFHDVFYGDAEDFRDRFPGVEWYCDRCGAHLNEQEGFDDHFEKWKCTACGYENPLAMSEIYSNDEDWQNRIRPTDAEKFEDALRRRKTELGLEDEERPGV